MIFLLYLFPWLAGLLMTKPNGYLFAVGMWAGICGYMVAIAGLIPKMIVGFDRDESPWPLIGLIIYYIVICVIYT